MRPLVAVFGTKISYFYYRPPDGATVGCDPSSGIGHQGALLALILVPGSATRGRC